MKLFSICVKVGHEPISPTESTTFLGTKVLRLPSFFQYVNEFEKMIVHSFFHDSSIKEVLKNAALFPVYKKLLKCKL